MSGLLFLDELLNAALDSFVGFFEPDRGALNDVCFGYFAGAVVWDGDNSAVCHGRMGKEEGLELSWRDLKTLDIG